MNFTRDQDREAIAHLVADITELEEAIRSRYLPAAQRLSIRPGQTPHPLGDALSLVVATGTGNESSLPSIREFADAVLTGSHPLHMTRTSTDLLGHLQVASAKYIALLDYTRKRITGLEWHPSEDKRRLVRNVDIAVHTQPFQHGTPASIYFLLGQILRGRSQ